MLFEFAYLDPGVGSLFVQAFIGTLAGIGFIFRSNLAKYSNKLASAVRRDGGIQEAEEKT